ncbi:MAG: hypothetical protein AUJ92_17875 [Armatimonadetes bacterium CG2_30_59_28]|nr:MAG: hypothetical protein AUJ92_17875 [Armatimonadetes bacterium CG2_30_59_28]PIU65352.1 MAG: hypothetical protein COS85_09145 [Armatimonadetes bacterium CG07_land_8_20_14_0_80_59_28]PIY49527.1 MAG: hypothetical protein COZ05_00165 [Armatimonadetes bacterium CG_4_10_14_3_um_filter_59_10]
MDRSTTSARAEPVKLQCPKCRTLTANNHPAFPLCSNRECTEYLPKCRYCSFYDSEMVECTNQRIQRMMGDTSGRVVIRDVDAYIECPEHSSTIVFNPVEQARKLVRYVTRIALTVVVVCGLAYGGYWVDAKIQTRDNRPPGVFLVTLAPDQVEVESEFTIRFSLQNLTDADTGELQLRLSERLFEWFELLEMNPMPRDMFTRGGGRYFVLSSVPGNSEMLVVMKFKPTQTGSHHCKVTVFSSEEVIYAEREFWIDVI